jgi:hypothetical protein
MPSIGVPRAFLVHTLIIALSISAKELKLKAQNRISLASEVPSAGRWPPF